MGSIHSNRRLSSWERFNNDNLTTSPGAARGTPYHLANGFICQIRGADGVYTKALWWCDRGSGSASVAGLHGWEQKAPGLHLLKERARTDLPFCAPISPSLGLLMPGLRYPLGVAPWLPCGWSVWLYLREAKTFEFWDTSSWPEKKKKS